MCFAASVGFFTGGLLLYAGSECIMSASGHSRRVFAVIPVIFAIQQIFEAFLRIWLDGGNALISSSTALNGYLVFSWVILPILIPIAIYLVEKDPKRRSKMIIPVCLGFLTGLGLLAVLLTYYASASLVYKHVIIQSATPELLSYGLYILFLFSSVAIAFLSGNRIIRWIGWTLLAAVVLSVFPFGDFFISIRCYFALIISFLILMVFYKEEGLSWP